MLVLVIPLGCGRIGFASVGSGSARDSNDGASDVASDVVADALAIDTTDTTGCWPLWRAHSITVDAPHAIAELAFARNEGDAELADAGLRLYFSRDTNGTTGQDIYTATRTDPGSPWTGAAMIPELESLLDDDKFTITADDLLSIFSSNRNGQYDLWSATRAAATDAWDAPTQTLLASFDTGLNNFDPQLSADGLEMYASVLTTRQSIVRASRASRADPFGTPAVLPELVLGVGAADPAPSPGGLVIAFTVNQGAGSDLFYSTRASTADSFGTVFAVPSVNGTQNDGDGALSLDGCKLLFTSDRSGVNQLYATAIH